MSEEMNSKEGISGFILIKRKCFVHNKQRDIKHAKSDNIKPLSLHCTVCALIITVIYVKNMRHHVDALLSHGIRMCTELLRGFTPRSYWDIMKNNTYNLIIKQMISLWGLS